MRTSARRDGHYLLRTNLVAEDPVVLWDRYIQLTQMEAAFKLDLSWQKVRDSVEVKLFGKFGKDGKTREKTGADANFSL